MEPLSIGVALSVATKSYGMIKKTIEAGAEFEQVMGQMSRWWGACQDISKANETAKKPPLFKKLFAKGSVEEEALAAFMAKKKAEDMREQLKQIISATRGPGAWQELIKTEVDIRKKRQKAIYDQKERQKHFWEIVIICFCTLFGAAILVGAILILQHL